jgi:hypothetical protein
MTALVSLPVLDAPLPRMVCPSQLDLGDLVRLKSEPLPVVLVGSELIDVHSVWSWVSQITTSAGLAVIEGSGVHDAGERIELLARGESVRADQVRDGDLLVLENRTSLWGVVASTPRLNARGIFDIAWRAGSLPSGAPATRGWLQREPHQMVRRAPRASAR